MNGLDISHDTTAFEVRPTDEAGAGGDWARAAAQMIDMQGFVVIPGLLTDEEAARGLRIVREELDNPLRERGTFASQTDIRFGRRDFVPLPLTEPVMSFTALVCKRASGVLLEFCGRSRTVLEISTLTSYNGSSHQYLHRDPSGVLCAFVALDDISPKQGGTVFAPATHPYKGGEERLDGRISLFAELLQAMTNWRVLRHNLAKVLRLRREGRLRPHEFGTRVFSRAWDDHQPNLLRFILGKNSVFDVRRLGPRALLRWRRKRDEVSRALGLVQTAPKRGSVILYRSDVLHAGADNCTDKPRFFFSMSIARDLVGARVRRSGYSPHATLLDAPKSLGDFLDYPA